MGRDGEAGADEHVTRQPLVRTHRMNEMNMNTRLAALVRRAVALGPGST